MTWNNHCVSHENAKDNMHEAFVSNNDFHVYPRKKYDLACV